MKWVDDIHLFARRVIDGLRMFGLNLNSGSITLGTGEAGVDYSITFDGEDNDGVIVWQEDEDALNIQDDVVIGSGEAGVDYTLTFNGSSSDGVITWMEDEDYFKFSDDIHMVDQEKITFDSADTYIGANTDDPEDLVIAADQDILLQADNQVVTDTVIRGATTLYRRYYHFPLFSADPGASGATWAPPSSRISGGWRINANTEYLYFEADVHTDWDAASDMTVETYFSISVSNTAGNAEDTVDLQLLSYYKGIGESESKTQSEIVKTTIGAAAQWTQFDCDFTLDYDAESNNIEAGDQIGFRLNIVTTSGDVNDVVIESATFFYNTTHLGIEAGDV